jgi:hypothetical protein
VRSASADNPFVFDRPVGPDMLIDREGEVAELVGLAEGGHSARVTGPRRYGKTSVLRRVLAEAERIGMPHVYVDLSGVLSFEQIAEVIERAYRSSLQGAPRRAFVAALRLLRPSVQAGVPGAGVQLSPQVDPVALHRLLDLLDLPGRLHERTGSRTLVVFDEFQDLLRADDQADALMRGRIQHHGDAASYVFAGSHPGMMRELFSDRERPFYAQARAITLARLPDSDLAESIGERFERAGRDAGEVLEPLLDLAAGHPQRAMLLAHHLFAHTPRGAIATAEEWEACLGSVHAETDEAMEATFTGRPPGQQALLAALAAGDGTVYSRANQQRFGVTKGAGAHSLRRLTDDGVLTRADEGLTFVDPLLADWLRRRYVGSSRDETP